MDKLLILYSMKGCPFCDMMKKSLNESNIDFIERDIHEHEEEYDLFVDATENEFVPSFMIIENPLEKPETFLYAPERDFNEIEDGVKIIKEHFNLLD